MAFVVVFVPGYGMIGEGGGYIEGVYIEWGYRPMLGGSGGLKGGVVWGRVGLDWK